LFDLRDDGEVGHQFTAAADAACYDDVGKLRISLFERIDRGGYQFGRAVDVTGTLRFVADFKTLQDLALEGGAQAFDTSQPILPRSRHIAPARGCQFRG
jgi:hypothetical protein